MYIFDRKYFMVFREYLVNCLDFLKLIIFFFCDWVLMNFNNF